jgi:hypothetical protein
MNDEVWNGQDGSYLQNLSVADDDWINTAFHPRARCTGRTQMGMAVTEGNARKIDVQEVGTGHAAVERARGFEA